MFEISLAVTVSVSPLQVLAWAVVQLQPVSAVLYLDLQ